MLTRLRGHITRSKQFGCLAIPGKRWRSNCPRFYLYDITNNFMKMSVMKARVFYFTILICSIFTSCSKDEEHGYSVSNSSIAGGWAYSEVNIDGTWIDAKKANQTGSILLTEDGYYDSSSKAYPYKIIDGSVQCYDEKGETINSIIRFSEIKDSTAEAKINLLKSGKNVHVKLKRDNTKEYIYKNPNTYLNGVWDIQGTNEGGTITFNYGYVEIKTETFDYKGSYRRYPNWITQISIYSNSSDYWGVRDPEFFIQNVDLDSSPNTLIIHGTYDRRPYSNMGFFCKKR